MDNYTMIVLVSPTRARVVVDPLVIGKFVQAYRKFQRRIRKQEKELALTKPPLPSWLRG